MAFKLENFGSEVANIKSILGGIRYFTYFNEASDDLTTAGYFPAKLGLKVGDVISAHTDSAGELAVSYGVTDVTDGVVTCVAQA